jgi:hypothetical protein
MKKIITFALAIIMAMSLASCAGLGSDSDCIYFQNDTGEKIDGFYISSMDEDEWGENLNFAKISVGGKITVDIEKLADGEGDYDIGAIDETGLVYEIYEVPVKIGDTFALSLDGENAILTVTGKDGSSEVFNGYTYMQDDVVE